MSEKSYRGFWGMETGTALEELIDFLSWNREDWMRFKDWMDLLEKKSNKKQLNKQQHRALAQRLHNLRYRGLVETKRLGDEIMVRLANDSWRRAMALRIKRTDERYDNEQCCIVTFDIPESERRVRNLFRRFLVECGFKQYQKSVWKCDRRIAHLVLAVVKDFKLQKWVTIIEGNLRS